MINKERPELCDGNSGQVFVRGWQLWLSHFFPATLDLAPGTLFHRVFGVFRCLDLSQNSFRVFRAPF